MRFNPDEYITVHERIEKFYAKFPQGRIITTIIQHNEETGFVLMRAEVYREPDDALPAATGHAYELRSAGHVQAGSYVEVCETSSVGRALALLGFEVRRGVASREEVIRGARKQQAVAAPAQGQRPAQERTPAPDATPAAPTTTAAPTTPATPAAVDAPGLDEQILQAAGELGYDAAKVRKWVNQKYEVTGGLDSLTPHDKREVLKIFQEQAGRAQQKAARK
ncbi:MAG: hypothetical protein ACJ74Q_00790 [Pyrinomonadaceae bacterium]|jgi:hypothetical protein